MKNLSIFISLILLFGSCSHQKQADNNTKVITLASDTISESAKVIDIGRKDIPIYSDCAGVKNKLSEIAAKIEFCALASEPSLDYEMIADVALTHEDIFILQGIDAVYRFDKTGIFRNKVGTQGQGPEEYVQPSAPMMLDYNQKLIYIRDGAQAKICSYQYDGTFVKSMPAGYRIPFLELMDSSTFIVRIGYSERIRPNTPTLMFMDKKGKIIKTHKSHIYPIEKENTRDWHHGAEVNALWKYAGNYYSLEYGSDTIFRIEEMNLVPVRTLSGEKYRPNLKNLFHAGGGDKRLILPILMRPNSAIFESDNFILFRSFDEKGRYFLIYDKSDGNVYISTHDDAPRQERTNEVLSSYFTDDLVSGMPFNPEYQSDGKLMGWLTASDVIKKRSEILQFIQEHPSAESEQLKKIVTNLEEEDNPVLMMVTLK